MRRPGSGARGAVRYLGDGPLRVRPPEEIVYGTGRCALGPILVAASDSGIVSIIVRDKAGELLKELRERFPKAVLTRDEAGCKATVAKVVAYVAAPLDRFPLPLDMRGTDLQQRVWREVQKIPCGESSTYAQVAKAIGAPKAVRAVASSCSRCGFAFAVPCHRVVSAGKAGDTGSARRNRWLAHEAKLLAKRSRLR